MLQEMDGIVDQRRQVFVLAATNLPENIDPSILSRFTKRLVVPLPDLNSRVRCSRSCLSKRRSIPCSPVTMLCWVNCRRECHSVIFAIGWLSHSAKLYGGP